MLALHCERSLIAPALPTAGRGSQHGGRRGCLPYLLLLSCHTLLKKKKKSRRNEEEGREFSQKAVRASWSLQSHHLLSAPLLFLLLLLSSLFFSQPETINGVLDQTASCLVLK